MNTTPTNMDDRTAQRWALFCHLSALISYLASFGILTSIIGPLIIWILKKDDHPFIDDQGKEAVNCQISMIIYQLIGGLTTCIGVGIVILAVVWVWNLIIVIIAAINAADGKAYRYPGIIRFV